MMLLYYFINWTKFFHFIYFIHSYKNKTNTKLLYCSFGLGFSYNCFLTPIELHHVEIVACFGLYLSPEYKCYFPIESEFHLN